MYFFDFRALRHPRTRFMTSEPPARCNGWSKIWAWMTWIHRAKCLEGLNLVSFISFMQKHDRIVIRMRILRRISCRKPRNGWSVLWAYAPQRFRTYFTYAQKVKNQTKFIENRLECPRIISSIQFGDITRCLNTVEGVGGCSRHTWNSNYENIEWGLFKPQKKHYPEPENFSRLHFWKVREILHKNCIWDVLMLRNRRKR